MIHAQTSKEIAAYANRYAAAQYFMGGGKGHPPRKGLIENHYYVGQVLAGGRFHVLKPDRMCSISEFLSFQLVSKRWHDLTELERWLLIAIYNQKKLALTDLPTRLSSDGWNEIASGLDRIGYLRWAESQVVELTLVGEAEVESRMFNLDAGASVVGTESGIRVQHHSVQNHEIELAGSSSLSVNVDGMVIHVFTLPGGGTVIRVDYDAAHHVYMCHKDETGNFAQIYIDRKGSIQNDEGVGLQVLELNGNGRQL